MESIIIKGFKADTFFRNRIHREVEKLMDYSPPRSNCSVSIVPEDEFGCFRARIILNSFWGEISFSSLAEIPMKAVDSVLLRAIRAMQELHPRIAS